MKKSALKEAAQSRKVAGNGLFETVPSEEAMDHICRGWVKRDGNSREWLLAGGGHGSESIPQLRDKDVSYYIDKKFETGVRFGFVHKGKRHGVHTWFPENWNHGKIRKAVQAVMESGCHTVKTRRDGSVVFYGWYENVRIMVVTFDNEIITAYPASYQYGVKYKKL